MAEPLVPPPSVAAWRSRLDQVRDGPVVRIAGGVVAVAAAGCVALVLLRDPGGAEIRLPRAVAGASAPGAAPTTVAAPSILVHVAGAVVRPGVQRLGDGARVTDAIDAAGGSTADADLDAVNLAAKVADGDRVYIPRKGESVPGGVVGPSGAGGPGAGASAPLDLNRATVEQLDALPGVGPATARAIVDYRTEHGRFRSVDELLRVRGIGPAKLAALRPRLRV